MNIANKLLSFSNTVIDSYSLKTVGYKCSGAFCGIVAAEMAIRTVGDVIHHHDNTELSANLAGTLFYGICAANIVPYTPVIGASIFVVHSFLKWNKDDNYVCTKILNATVETIYKIVKCIFTSFIDYLVIPVTEHIIVPIFTNVIIPLAKTIAQIFADIFQRIHLTENPKWIGVTLLVIAIVLKNVFVPVARQI